ncbi:hypothetical protein D3C75_1083010 [compost metagenome]
MHLYNAADYSGTIAPSNDNLRRSLRRCTKSMGLQGNGIIGDGITHRLLLHIRQVSQGSAHLFPGERIDGLQGLLALRRE